MAVTFTVTPYKVWSNGDKDEMIANIACTGTPTAGGDALTAALLRFEGELNAVDPLGGASLANGTGYLDVGVIHPATPSMTQVLVVFYVAHATPGGGVAGIPYTGATANYNFRVRVVGKGSATGTAS